MAAVDIMNPVPPAWYVENHNLDECIELVRNGNAVFWKIELTNPAWGGEKRPDFGLFLPGSGYTPKGAVLFSPPPGKAGLSLPGLTQYVPGSAGYPHVKSGSVLVNLSGQNLDFKLS